MSRDSQLLALPPELRNIIYRCVLVSDTPINISCEASITPPTLLDTCRRIREEAISIYYHENTFAATAPTFGNPSSTSNHVLEWFAKTGATHCRVMAKLCVTIQIRDSCQTARLASQSLLDKRGYMFEQVARVFISYLVSWGLQPGAIHLKAPGEITTLMDQIWTIWHKAGQRDLEERVAKGDLYVSPDERDHGTRSDVKGEAVNDEKRNTEGDEGGDGEADGDVHGEAEAEASDEGEAESSEDGGGVENRRSA
ncbi:hypothetical protein LTR85_011564 [Meristemomyces frigidus]|nr:hypothetical protein LTR85_011564 [Meristemomyces frigidus]